MAVVRKPTLRQAFESLQLPEKISITRHDRFEDCSDGSLTNSVEISPVLIDAFSSTAADEETIV